MTAEVKPWIRRVEEAIEEAKLIPLWGAVPAFPWDEFTHALSKALALPKLALKLEKAEWKKAESFLIGLGQKPHVSSLELTPLSDVAFIAISSEDLEKLTAACLTKAQEGRGFSHPDFQEGFFHFMLLEALSVSDQLKCFGDLSAKLGKPFSLHNEEGGFCYDIRIDLSGGPVRIRLICPSMFHQAFRAHFSIHKPSLTSSPLARGVQLPIHMEIGSSSLAWEKWQSVDIGDLVILDRCSFDPDLKKGSVTLALGKTPLFRCRLKEGNLKILDYALYNEENMSDDKEFEEEVPGEGEEGSPEEAIEEPVVEEVEEAPAEMLPLQEVPLTLTVEIGRLSLSLEKLMQMKPGNLLELGTPVDQDVHLTLQGKRVARGELVKIGDLLGVRVLELPDA
jgi:flagellar motor switch protein FliN/FliY